MQKDHFLSNKSNADICTTVFIKSQLHCVHINWPVMQKKENNFENPRSAETERAW